MNSEPISSDIFMPLADELSLPDDPKGTKPVIQHRNEMPLENEDNEELAFAKAPTLMMDAERVADEMDSAAFILNETVPRYYIQGVVLGRRACLITNLLDGISQTLFQPQMVWTIGRNRDAALPLRDRALSRRHSVLHYQQDQGFYLVDLNSMNGSFVNGVRLQQRQLMQDGDRIRIGSIEFTFFTSKASRSIDPIHPEVLTRFTSSKSRGNDFIDYSALEDPPIVFGTSRES